MPVNYMVIMDFEATCFPSSADRYSGQKWFQEIIEVGALILNMQSGRIEDEFHSYVRPTAFPRLSAGCLDKLHITQRQVDGAPSIKDVLQALSSWTENYANRHNVKMPDEQMLFRDQRYMVYTTWSSTDLGVFLRNECIHKRITVPWEMQFWIDAQSVFQSLYPGESTRLDSAMNYLGVQRCGSAHTAMGDAKTLAGLVLRMKEHGGQFNRLNRARD